MSLHNRYKNPMLTPSLQKNLLKVLPTEKSLVVSFWTFFSNFTATEANQKEPKPPKIFVDAEISF